MKAKIFAKLKQEYSYLGLGDEVLMSRAESLAALGLVTDENLDAVVAVQRGDLEAFQSRADKRVTDALEKERKKFEEENKKKAEEKLKAEEEAKKAAEEAKRAKEAEEAKRLAEDEEAKKQAEAEAKRQAELEKLKKDGLSDSVLAYLNELNSKAVEERKKADENKRSQEAELESRLAKMLADAQKRNEEFALALKSITDNHTALKNDYDSLKAENDAAKAAKAKSERDNFILSKAKELGVPQWRIDEGFKLADDATEQNISDTLTTIANNVRTAMLPGSSNIIAPSNGTKPTAEEIKELANSIVK